MPAPAVFGFSIPGLMRLYATLTQVKRFVEQHKDDEWWVASAAKYSGKLETRDPHWLEGVAVAALFADTEYNFFDPFNEKTFQEVLADRMVRHIRIAITSHGLVDTGNYRGSIAKGRSLADAVEQSRGQLILPETAVENV